VEVGSAGRSRSAESRIYLETKRLVLRSLTEEDAENLHVLDADPEVMRYLNDGRLHTRTEIVEQVLPHYLDHHARYGERYGFFTAIEKASGRFIGWFHFRPYLANPDEIELGYRLMRDAWGRGYATEGSRALIRKGFVEFGVDTIVADTLVGNVRSRRVMEALGMHLRSEFALDADEFPDWDVDQRRGVEYAITRAEWEAGGTRQA
jgi:RimJ/RimL family protein N-acetyltransferase